MKIRLLCVGRISEAYLRDGIAEFAGRVRRYLPLEIVELREEKGGKRPDVQRLCDQEGARLLEKIPAGAYVVALDEGGRRLTSETFAGFFEEQMVRSTPEVTFIIGGPYGLSAAIRERSQLVLSLSDMTFTHQMVRLFLLEQIYRGMTILRNEPYHHR